MRNEPTHSERCGACKWWLLLHVGGETGSCKRYPPSVDPVTHMQALPTLVSADWCGEFIAD